MPRRGVGGFLEDEPSDTHAEEGEGKQHEEDRGIFVFLVQHASIVAEDIVHGAVGHAAVAQHAFLARRGPSPPEHPVTGDIAGADARAVDVFVVDFAPCDGAGLPAGPPFSVGHEAVVVPAGGFVHA